MAKKLPKIKSKKKKSIQDVIKQLPDIKTIIDAPKTFKKVLLEPIKNIKEFGKNFKLAIEFQIVSEIPILGFIFGKKSKTKKAKVANTKLQQILNQLRLIVLGMGGKPSKTPSEEKATEEEKPAAEKIPDQKNVVSSVAKGGLIAGGIALLYSMTKPSTSEVKPQTVSPNIPQPILEERKAPDASGAEQNLANLEKEFVGFSVEAKNKAKDTEKAKKEYEKNTDTKVSEKSEAQQQTEQTAATVAAATPPSAPPPAPPAPPAPPTPPPPPPTPAPPPTPPVREERPKPVKKPTPAEQDKIAKAIAQTQPGEITTGSGGKVVTSEGKAVTAPVTIPEAKPVVVTPPPQPAPLPRPTPAPAPAPAPRPAPAPAPRPAPAPAPAPAPRPPVAAAPQPAPAAPGGKVDLKSVVTTQPGVDMSGFTSMLEDRVAAMAADFQKKTGKKLLITSGFRSNEKQNELFQAKLKQVGGDKNKAKQMVAEPMPPLGQGRGSKHMVGMAIDINPQGEAGLNKLAGPRTASTGWLESFGLARPVNNEDWHVEPAGKGGPPTPDNPANPGGPTLVANKGGAVDLDSGKKVNTPPPAVLEQSGPDTSSNINNASSAVEGQKKRPVQNRAVIVREKHYNISEKAA